MPSTYSPNLRIQLIANGEQSGTWGTTTNVNLGSLLEQAITGYQEVLTTVNPSYLQAIDGAVDEARNMVVSLATTTGGPFSVAIPPREKMYVFVNTSAHAATIYAATDVNSTTVPSPAGATVTVPSGKTMLVYCEGNSYNVREGVNHISALTAGSLALTTALPIASGGTGTTSTTFVNLASNVTGTLPIANGGTGSTSTTFVNLASNVTGTLPVANGGTGSTTSTGSGSVVLATSPTLVTPALGTPASGNLANCTFPTLNQSTTGNAANVTGVVAASNGGTGQSSYAVGDLVFASTTTALSKLADVATGSALISGGVGVAPSYGKIGLTTHVSGTLPTANGGTGSTSTTFVNLASNVTGTLPVANGGTGVTTSTGSGSVVLSTSPTLVTPVLGTPTSGDLANCTFPTLNQNTTGTAANVTGTVAVANGGTGQTTYTNGQILIGNTVGNTLVKATLTGTANQITVTNGSGSITLSTPQSIATTSDVRFDSFGVGTNASGVTGEIRATDNVTAYYSSDKQYKENIRDIPNALDIVSAVGGKLFSWTDAYVQSHGGEDGYFIQKEDFGVVAQDVQDVFPAAVRTRPDGSLAVDYAKLSALSFAAIKELRLEIESLKGR